MITQHFFMPNFYQDYANYYYEHAKAGGASAAELLACKQQMSDMMDMLKNPFMEYLMTFIEPFPIGLAVTIISAIILRKKSTKEVSI